MSQPWDIGEACIHRCDMGAGAPRLTLAEAVEQVTHPVAGASKVALVEVIAYLSCQVVGYQRSQNADAKMAMAQVRRIVKDYEARHGAQL
jgi:hypothetical protein